MINKKLSLSGLIVFVSLSQSWAGALPVNSPLYFGYIAGYGSTIWDGLVPRAKNQNEAINASTPTFVREGGGVWGVLLGYELNSNFALEVNYLKYEDAEVNFDPEWSIFTSEHDGATQFDTSTETVSLMGKVMIFIPKTKIRVYSSAGIADLHRYDMTLNDWRFTPTFGLGVNYSLTDHILAGIDANYTAGFGESQLKPADTYFPFLYSLTARLAYRF